MKQSTTGHFITLTYSDENLPLADTAPTLCKKDLQNWLKRLRKKQDWYTDTKIRYYSLGEYGPTTGRPHYHIITFNLDQRTVQDVPSTWPLGHVKIDPVNPARIHYITKYHVNAEQHEENDPREPSFSTMSRNPGIGHNYAETTRKWHTDANRSYVVNNGYRQRMPRYYREKIFPKIIRDIQTAKNMPILQANYEKEIQRLSQLKIKDPERYIQQSQLIQAQKVKNKGNENTKI